jgi:hypothetical protein
MASIGVWVQNGPLGNSNPRDDTIYIRLLNPYNFMRCMWAQNYRSHWKTEWHRSHYSEVPPL